MALAAASVFEVQTGGVDTNGGGFVTGAAGTDYSLVAAKRTATGSNDSTTDAVAVGSGVITSATAAFTSAIVGNIIYLQGGTGVLAAGWYQVTVYNSATSIIVDRNVATGTGITMNIGGALASPGMAGGVGLVTGNIVYIKAGTYTIASATINIATGCFSSALAQTIIHGYQTTRGDLGTRPLLQASGIATFTIISNTGADSSVVNVTVNGASLTSSRGFLLRGMAHLLAAANCTNSGIVHSSALNCSRSTATGCSTQPAIAIGVGLVLNCVAYDNTVTGFSANSTAVFVRCIADSNSGASSDGFFSSGSGGMDVVSCVSYNNGRHGIYMFEEGSIITNNICELNAGWGIEILSGAGSNLLVNNATYNNTSGSIDLSTGKGNLNIGAVAGSGSFFTNAAGQDFSLNTTAGAGAAARAAGYPGAMPIGGTGYLDIGPLQHADPAGGGGGGPVIGGSIVRAA